MSDTKRQPGGGGTAMITGASSGIGTAFARRLAADGYKLLLVARREARLAALATELQQCYAVQSEILVADLAVIEDVARVEKCIAATEMLTMLVNNAGFGTTGSFADSDLTKQLAMVHVHINTSMCLCHAALPDMLARRRGDIINVSSIAAFIPASGNATYSASKAFLNVFTEALHAELQGTGVRVQTLCPGFTMTEFHDTPEFGASYRAKIPHALWMSPEDVVTASLSGLERGEVMCIPGMRNRLTAAAARNPLLARVLRTVRGRLLRR